MNGVSKATVKKVRDNFGQTFKKAYIKAMSISLKAFAYLPYSVVEKASLVGTGAFDLMISNTPGLTKEMKFNGSRVYSINGFAPTIGVMTMIIYINTYNQQTKIQVMSDKAMKMDPVEFVSRLEQAIDESIELHKK